LAILAILVTFTTFTASPALATFTASATNTASANHTNFSPPPQTPFQQGWDMCKDCNKYYHITASSATTNKCLYEW
jgi:hypothetical protein